MNRRLLVGGVAALLLVTAMVVVWRPWNSCDAPRELCAALDQVRSSDDVVDARVSYEITTPDPKDGDQARASWMVRFADDLTPSRAGAAAVRAVDIIEHQSVDKADVEHSVELTAGEPVGDKIPVYPLSVIAGDNPDVQVAQAYDLWRAGAARVSTGTAETTDTDRLLSLADFAAEHGYPTGLATTDGSARYESTAVVVPEDVRLVVEAARLDDVETAIFSADRSLIVHTTSADASEQTAEVLRWIKSRTPPGDEPVPYTVTSPGYATVRQGWVGGVSPPEPEPHGVPLPAGVEPWPHDPSAPDCTGDDLRLTIGMPDAAAGSRYLAVRAANVSDRPCALDGVPEVSFLNADDEPQADVTIVPAGPGVVAERVVLPADERAMATMQWRAMSTANDPDVTTTLQVTAVPGAEPVRLKPRQDEAPNTLDVLDGAEVRVGPWAQAVDGWSTP